jgi:hypothetical protein
VTNEELLAAIDARFKEVARRLDENDRRWAELTEVQRRRDIPLGPLDFKFDRLLERLRASLNESDRPEPSGS